MAQRPARPNMDDDIDDIMASIMRGESAEEYKPKKQRRPFRKPQNTQPSPAPQQHRPYPKHRQRLERPHPQSQRHQPYSPPVQQPTQKAAKKPRKQRKTLSTRKIVSLIAIPVVIGVLAASAYFLRGPIASLLRPQPPFSQEIVDNMGVPLFYPTKLPGTYKLETDSITQPEKSVVVYAISDDDGKRININQQPQPSDINLDPLYAVLDKVREIDTKFGKVKIGVNEGTTNIANILTGDTWIILNFSTDTIQDAGIAQIINSLEN